MKKYEAGWGFQTLQHCVRAAYTFSEEEIVYAVRTQLTWTHLRSLMSLEDELKRSFYMELPDKKLLAEKLQRAIAIAREHHLEKQKRCKQA